MRTATFAAVSALALVLAACQGVKRPERAVTRLDCPETSGGLTRLSVAPDGKTCRYRSEEGADITLKLVPVTGDLKATLASLEAEALALRGPDPAPAPAPAPASADGPVGAEGAARDAAATLAQAQADAGVAEDEKTAGAAIIVDDESADIDVPGLRVVADDEGASIKIGGVQIHAGEHGATIRDVKDVRLRGEATSREKRGVRAVFLKVSGEGDPLPSVAYQAAGPKAGPITAAVTRWTSGEHDEFYEDVRKLVRRNGGA